MEAPVHHTLTWRVHTRSWWCSTWRVRAGSSPRSTACSWWRTPARGLPGERSAMRSVNYCPNGTPRCLHPVGSTKGQLLMNIPSADTNSSNAMIMCSTWITVWMEHLTVSNMNTPVRESAGSGRDGGVGYGYVCMGKQERDREKVRKGGMCVCVCVYIHVLA